MATVAWVRAPPCPHVAAGAVLGRAFPAPPRSRFADREDSCWRSAPLDPAQPHTAPSRFAELPAPPRGWVCSLPSPAAEEAFIRWGNRTGGRPLTHGLFTRRACESYSEKCVTVRHPACAQTWGRHGARRGGEGTREVWAEPRGAAAPRPRSPWWGRGRSGDGQGGLGQGLPGRCRARRCRSAVPWVPGASPPLPLPGGRGFVHGRTHVRVNAVGLCSHSFLCKCLQGLCTRGRAASLPALLVPCVQQEVEAPPCPGEQRGAGLPALPSPGHSRPCRPAPGRCPGLSTGATGATEAWPRCPAPPRPPAPRTSCPGPPAGLSQPCGQRDRFVRNSLRQP